LVRTPGAQKPGFQPKKGAMSGGLNLDERQAITQSNNKLERSCATWPVVS